MSISSDAIRRSIERVKLSILQRILFEERGIAMANFVLLYTGGGMAESEAEQAAVMQAWGAWFGELGNALVDAGNPFAPTARSIASDGKVSDGPVGTMAT